MNLTVLQTLIEAVIPEGESEYQDRYRFITDIDTNDIRPEAKEKALELLEDLEDLRPQPTFEVYFSSVDGVCVVHVDTDDLPENEGGPIIRISLNDSTIHENPVFPGKPVV